jgi:hypothetical protein
VRIACLLLAVAGVVLCAGPASAAPRTVPYGFHGVHLDRDITEASGRVQRAHAALMARSGVESVRTVFSWAHAQVEGPGSADFSRTDRVVAHAARRGMDVLPVVMYAPPWAQLNAELASPPASPTDYAAYLGLLVDRYGPGGSFWRSRRRLPERPIRNWQIWNEPHLQWQWSAPTWLEEYVTLLRHAHAAVKQRDPGARVVLAGLTNFGWQELARVYAAGGGAFFDVAAAHAYTGRPPRSLAVLRRFRRVMDRAGDGGKPLWMTEASWPAGLGRMNSTADFAVDDLTMAAFLFRFYRAAARSADRLRLQRVYWYTWASSYRVGRDIFEYAGLLSFAHGRTRPRPALRAFARSARSLQGCVKTARGECRPEPRRRRARRSASG